MKTKFDTASVAKHDGIVCTNRWSPQKKRKMKKILLLTLVVSIFQIDKECIAQSNIQIGSKAPKIEIKEWIGNVRKDKSLEGKYIVLEFWASWCKPCLEIVPHINSLSKEYSSDKLIFLSMTSESKQIAKKIMSEVNFETPVVIDKNKQTHINFGDGAKDLVYYPMTVLIDDQNIIRWYGSSDNLKGEMIEQLLNNEKINVKQLSQDGPNNIIQNSEDLLQREFSLQLWSDMFMDPNIIQATYIEEITNPEVTGPSLYMGNGAFYESISLNALLYRLFPNKKFKIPSELKDKIYRFYFIDKALNSDSDDTLIKNIADQLSLISHKKKEETNIQMLVINDKSLLQKGNKKNKGIKTNIKDKLIFTKNTISELASQLSSSTNYYWKYEGKSKSKYY